MSDIAAKLLLGEEDFITRAEMREHHVVVDEPTDEGGSDKGARPTELLAASLGSCTAITLRMYAKHKGWDFGDIVVDVKVEDADSCKIFHCEIQLSNEIDDDQLKRA